MSDDDSSPGSPDIKMEDSSPVIIIQVSPVHSSCVADGRGK
jgi:hypothetical protein